MAESSLVDRLGIRHGYRVDVLDLPAGFLVEALRQRGADVDLRPRRGSDVVILGAEDREALAALTVLEKVMNREGAIWVVHPKRSDHVDRPDVLSAAREAGLADGGSTEFSETHDALRLVLPPERRNAPRRRA